MFRTELSIAPATDQLPRTGRVLTMGSCFADSIGARLALNKVETLANPFGTVFQPLALARLLRAAAGEDVDWQQHVVEANGRWQSYDLHSSIGASSPVELLQRIQELVRRTGDFLRQADVVLITLGTAWAYRLRETGELVSNCHKKPAELFDRELLTPDDIINALAETHAYLRRANPNLRFVLTVSPVRHLKDTLPLNSVSKSVLRLATHFVSDLLPGVAYFPAYELLTDDLRDYRFYAADMLHPSEVAEDYIWEKFARTYFDAEFGRFRKDWAAIRQALGHRPLHEAAPEHRQFLENTLARLEQLSLRKVNLDAEIANVRARLAALPLPAPTPASEEDEDDEERIDIGTAAEVSPQAGQAASPDLSADNRSPRLSPEEFRAQRDGRPARGRRNSRGRRDERTERVAAHAVDELSDAVAASHVEPAYELGPPDDLKPEVAAASSMEEANASGLHSFANSEVSEPAKKKKRRSRGGAKRTARKHALQQAELAQAQAAGAEVPRAVSEEAPSSLQSDDAPAQQPKVSVITKSVPVKRGNRRGMPTQPLYATPPVESEARFAQDNTPESPTPVTAPIADATQAAATDVIAGDVLPLQSPATGKNSRRKKSSKPSSALLIDAEGGSGSENRPAPAGEESVDAAGREPASTGMTPVAEPTEQVQAPLPAEAERPVRKSNRAKRAITGGRTVKPEVDTPVIPLQAGLTPRTQVAAGRMTGSVASLVETAQPTLPATAKKRAAPRAKSATPAAALPAPAPVAEASSPPKAAKAKKPVATKSAKSKAALSTDEAAPAKAKAPRKPPKPKPVKPE